MSDRDDPRGGSPLSRREFMALSVAAGIAAAAQAADEAPASGALPLTEEDVRVPTPSGECDCALIRPAGEGRWPAVILFPDAFGLRPTMRTLGRRLASEGYVVLAINPFYRAGKAPVTGTGFDFQNPADRARLGEIRAALTNDAVAQDTAAFLSYLDARPFVNAKARAGAFGYCMGGLMTIQAAAGAPGRIGAGASFHAGGLVTDQPDSPHRLVARSRGRFLVAIAESDHERQPEAKAALVEAFRAAGVPAKVEVYEGTRHGWCVPDMPKSDGRPVYHEAQAERAWRELTALFEAALV